MSGTYSVMEIKSSNVNYKRRSPYDSPHDPNVVLWLSVIEQAMVYASKPKKLGCDNPANSSSIAQRRMVQAHKWIFHGEQLVMLCDLLELDIEAVRHQTTLRIERAKNP